MDSYFLNDILECSVCFKPLDENNKVLPCQHTFCRACLSAIVRTQKELRCPECRVVVKQRVEDLPSNILLIRLLDGIKLQQDHYKSHSDKHARRHSVEGILSEPVPASGGAKDGGSARQNKSHQDRASSTRVQHEKSPSEPQANTRPYAHALFTYKSDQPSDLSFLKGDMVYLLKRIDDNWMSGECRGKMGVFPINYVKVVVPLPSEQPLCVALYDFESKNESQDRDCLAFNKNEKILAIRRVDENWAEGVHKDKIGIFPLSFVKLNDEAKKLLDVKESTPAEGSENVRPSNPQRIVAGAGAAARRIVGNKQAQKQQAKKRHSFPAFHAAKAKDEPTTSHRHSMEILDSESSAPVAMPTNNAAIMATTTLAAAPGASAAQQPKTGELVVRLRQKRPTEITVPPTSSSSVPQKLPGLLSVDGARASATRSVFDGARASQNENKGSAPDRSKSADHLTPRNPNPSRFLSAAKIVTANYSYKAVKPDELELVKGDSYQITEVCNDGWCRGRHVTTGKIGVFPGNYVTPAVPVTRSSPIASRSPSGSISSASSSSSTSPTQPPRSTRTSDSGSHTSSGNHQHKSASSSSNRRTPPPRPQPPPSSSHSSSAPIHLHASSKSGAPSSSSGNSPAVSGLKIPGKPGSGRKSADKDKKREKNQLLLKMITGGAKKTKSNPTTPTSPSPRTNHPLTSPGSPSTSQAKPSLKPLMRDKYRAVLNYPAHSPEELDLREGDVIIVHQRRPDGWFRGTHQSTGRSGHFPSTFVERMPAQ